MARFVGHFPTEFVNGVVQDDELYCTPVNALDACDNEE